MRAQNWQPRVGDWVEIRPLPEILASLDERGEFDRMPFMPEMLRFVGRRFRVSASAHKTCDTVNNTGSRSVRNAVHLADLRCDGSGHGTCQAECLLFWKTAWLKPATEPGTSGWETRAAEPIDSPTVLETNSARTLKDGVKVYRCQATTLPAWTEPLRWWSLGQYWRDVRSGNVSLADALRSLLLASIRKLRQLPFAYRFNCWLYDRAHLLLRGTPDPTPRGLIPRDGVTPDVRIDLQVGETVRIRSLAEINSTLNVANRNRGLHIDAEMTRYCGRNTRVTSRVTRIINEQTGEMMHFQNPCIVLQDTECRGDYSDRRLLCPRRIRTYWREAWVERVDKNSH